jgi:ribosome biogenesis GTPase
LLNTELDTGQVRHGDLRGKHTTTWSEVLCLPEGGLLIDTPGIRDIQLWADEQGLRESFEDVEALIAACRFVDCGHQSEPGCAVQQAVLDGTLDLKRLESYRKLKKEIQFLEDKRIHLSAKEDGNKKLSKSSRKWKKDHPKI